MLRLAKRICVILFVTVTPMTTTELPHRGKPLPQGYYDRIASNPKAFKFQDGFLKLTEIAREGREKVKAGASPIGILTDVRGHKRILVLPIQFSDTPLIPYEASALENRLFGTNRDGSDLPGTLSAYYRENSYGKLLLSGIVMPWKMVSHTSAYYAGKAPAGSTEPCNGVCPNSKVVELVEEAVKLNDDPTLWGQFDNDGPDDISNSRDDDGKVDFIVIVHPGSGAECENSAEASLWSHQDLLSSWAGRTAYTTKTKSNGKVGGNIQVDDYVLVPAVACDATTPIQIGVIAHEFGHSLGLPDLYDTSRNARSEGLGNWDLMAGGSWGGDGNSPEMPVHMSAWSKGYLGWVKPKDVITDTTIAALKDYETQDDVYLVTINKKKNIYYLISNRQRVHFDSKIPGEGILILRVNEERLRATLGQNTVNRDPANMGVEVIEADGLKQLIHHPPAPIFRGGPDDTFPGGSHKRILDNTSTPASDGTIAICEIGDSSNSMSLRIFPSRPNCPAVAVHESDRVSIKALLTSPAEFVDATVRVEGLLKNETPNYFRGRPKLTIRDLEGNAISVSPWLPREIPPGPQGHGPPVQSEFLDRIVELTGRLKAQPSPDRYIFQVDSARVLQ